MAKKSQNNKSNSALITSKDKQQKKTKSAVKIEESPIAAAITKFVHEVRDIEVAALIHIQLAFDRRKNRFDSLLKTIEDEEKKIKEKDKTNIHIGSIMKIMEATENLIRLQRSKVPQMLELSLFLGLFSVYDNFTGELMSAIYLKKPDLFNRVNHTISLSEILQYGSFDELKNVVLQQEIEDFRRKSYVEQFDELERMFDIKLKEFQRWGDFVECGQRRNLLTHAGGIVSRQYIKMCEKSLCPNFSK